MPQRVPLHDRQRPARRRRGIARSIATVGAIFAGLLSTSVGVAASGGTALLEDSFTNGEVLSNAYVIGGVETPCLTATGSGTSVPGRCDDAGDTPGSGALRLTTADLEKSGFLLYNRALPTKAGLDIEFNFYQYGGDGADGISFFLTDGSETLVDAGPAGGSLGYHTRDGGDGLAHALLGIGFDAYGNYGYEWNDPSCPIQGSALAPDTIAVRGPGGADRDSGYCLLNSPVSVPGGIDNEVAANRVDAAHTARIIIDPPSDANPKVRVFLDGVEYAVVDQPAVLGTTPTFKFGWAASTGGSTNIHEINFLKVESVEPIMPELSLTATGATANAYGMDTISFTPTVDAAGGPESQPVVVSIVAPSELSAVSAPSGTDWVCTEPTSNTWECTHTPGSAIAPDTQLPSISATFLSTSSGVFDVTGTVSSSDNVSTGAATTADATMTFRPVAHSVEYRTSATNPGSTHTFTPSAPAGTGPFTYAIDDALSGLGGTLSVDSSTGEFTYNSPSNASGIGSFTYTVTGAGGTTSGPTNGQIFLRPAAVDVSATTPYLTEVDTPAPSTIGTAPFAYVIDTAPNPAAGTATIDGSTGVTTFTPATGFSGVLTYTYTVSDGSGLASDPATVTLAVLPSLTSSTGSIALDSSGNGSVTTNAPTPSGTGPFTFELVAQPTTGSASIDAGTGAITYTAAQDQSGTFTVEYTTTDVNAVESDPQTATITVRPYASDVTATTDASTAITLPAPTLRGSGPYTATVDTPLGTSATIGTNGQIDFDPQGHSGTFSFTYTVTDSNGVDSGQADVDVTVRPIADALTGSAIVSATPSAVNLASSPIGDGTFTYSIVDAPPASRGTAVATSTGVSITPAAGASGRITASYLVTGRGTISSTAAPIVVNVAPLAADATVSTTSGTTKTIDLPTPSGTGPFTMTIAGSLPSAAGTATVTSDGRIELAAAPTFSGPTQFTYTVTDGDGFVSAPATVSISVAPKSVPSTLPSTTAGGTGSVSHVVPAPSGTGPFTFELVGDLDPAIGTATIDPTTGEITITPAPGVSGTIRVTYRVKDASGTASETSSVSLDVRPAATPATAKPATSTTTGTKPLTIKPETPVGKGPFTYRIVNAPTPDQGTVTIDPVTGEMTFVAAPGFTGTATFSYEVVDADGIVSAPSEVAVEVLGAEQQRPSSPIPQSLAFTGGSLAAIPMALGMLCAGSAIVIVRRKRDPQPTA